MIFYSLWGDEQINKKKEQFRLKSDGGHFCFPPADAFLSLLPLASLMLVVRKRASEGHIERDILTGGHLKNEILLWIVYFGFLAKTGKKQELKSPWKPINFLVALNT